MSQPSEMKETNPIDTTRVYCTSSLIKRVGGAVAVSLEDATLPGNTRNKHMTILYRRSPRWTDKEIELISRETDAFIHQKYGNNKAPITFTISPWGSQSYNISGDLYELCIHLRNTFASLSNDKQRPPHVELFKRERRNKNRNNKDKTCNICGELGHFKKNCPQKHNKTHSKCNGKKNNKCNGKNKLNQTEKMKQRLQKMISKTNGLKHKKQSEIDILNEQEIKLQNLLDNADTLDIQTLKNEIKNIANTFKHKRKQYKCNKKMKFKKDKSMKLALKESKLLARQQRKKLKEERKKLKEEKKQKLLLAQLQTLPSKSDINNCNILYIYVDGYNIIGCDSICRKNMRGRGGMNKSRMRLAELLQNKFLNLYNSGYLKLDYLPIIKLWFDGNGKDMQYNEIDITFSSKKQIVDDKLVELFSKNNKLKNSNVLVITSDRELTLRLDDIGVKVMKSSVFYKTYLKDNGGDNDEKKEEIMETNDMNMNENDCDGFVEIISEKINGTKGDESEETSSTDYGQIEGGNDEEFTEIFGEEDMDMDTDEN